MLSHRFLLSAFQHLLLIGMSPSLDIAKSLSRTYNLSLYDMDHVMESYVPTNKSSLLEWYHYRKREYELLVSKWNSPFPSIISLSDGCIEYAPTYHLLQNKPDSHIILHLVTPSSSRSSDSLWMKRGKYYFSISDLDFWTTSSIDDLPNLINSIDD